MKKETATMDPDKKKCITECVAEISSLVTVRGTRKTGKQEERIAFDPFVPEIHCAADGTLYQSVRSCDLERIRDK